MPTDTLRSQRRWPCSNICGVVSYLRAMLSAMTTARGTAALSAPSYRRASTTRALLSLSTAHSESYHSCLEVLRDLVKRGLQTPVTLAPDSLLVS